ncbi:MAG: hypothetical protein JXQ90_11270 [Cyclobacteriaceae bacterium]
MRLILISIIVSSSFMSIAQYVPLGTPGLDITQRLNNLEDSSKASVFHKVSYQNSSELYFTLLDKPIIEVSWLAPQLKMEFNSQYPYYHNNYNLLPTKGLQSLFSTGINLETPIFRMQIRPELVWSQNSEYRPFSNSLPDAYWQTRYKGWNRTDAHGYFGQESIRRLLPGQSYAKLHYKHFIEAGISTENIRWGPGRFGNLILGPSTQGFNHISIGSETPIETPLGGIEYQVVMGRLENNNVSPIFPPEHGLNPFTINKRREYRYFSGFSLAYHSNWLEGLSIAINLAQQQYWSDAKDQKSYFPIGKVLFREGDGGNDDDEIRDQVFSITGRWIWQKTKTEIYYEYGLNDSPWNFRYFSIIPGHTRTYVFGITKSLDFGEKTLLFGFENISLSQSTLRYVLNPGSWYEHYQIRQGLTHLGEPLGSSIPVGSDRQTIDFNLISESNIYSIIFERTIIDQDFSQSAFANNRRWVELAVGPKVNFQLSRLRISTQARFIKVYGYQWEVNPSITSNMNLTLNLMYQL